MQLLEFPSLKSSRLLLDLGLQGSLLTAGQRRRVPGRPGRDQPAVIDGRAARQVVKRPRWTLFNRHRADKGDGRGEKTGDRDWVVTLIPPRVYTEMDFREKPWCCLSLLAVDISHQQTAGKLRQNYSLQCGQSLCGSFRYIRSSSLPANFYLSNNMIINQSPSTRCFLRE